MQLGTAPVNGDGPHAGPGEGEVLPSPTSATSLSRLAGEHLVLAGGTVVRPYLVYGRGDIWWLGTECGSAWPDPRVLGAASIQSAMPATLQAIAVRTYWTWVVTADA